MPELDWSLNHDYHHGIDRVAVYPDELYGSAWPGIVSVAETTDAYELTPWYLDGQAYKAIAVHSNFSATITGYTITPQVRSVTGYTPIGTGGFIDRQPLRYSGLTYRTKETNGITGETNSFIHLVYGCLFAPSPVTHTTDSEKVSTVAFEWEVTSVPPEISTWSSGGVVPTAHFIFQENLMTPTGLATLKNALYGTAGTPAEFPDAESLVTL